MPVVCLRLRRYSARYSVLSRLSTLVAICSRDAVLLAQQVIPYKATNATGMLVPNMTFSLGDAGKSGEGEYSIVG